MNDIAGLKWPQRPVEKKRKANPDVASSFQHLTLQPSPTPPVSGRSSSSANYRSTDISGRLLTPTASRGSTPSNDSFSNLVSFGSGHHVPNLSLLEKQKRLEEEKARKISADDIFLDGKHRATDDDFWNRLEQKDQPSSQSGPVPGARPAGPLASGSCGAPKAEGLGTGPAAAAGEDDLLENCSSDAPVRTSIHAPIATILIPDVGGEDTSNRSDLGDADDDPFGLGLARKDRASARSPSLNHDDDDDDVLGVLGKPVVLTQEKDAPDPQSTAQGDEIQPTSSNVEQKALIELIHMGFPDQKAKDALATTQSGLDVQAAVGWLVDAAHREAKDQRQGRAQHRQRTFRDESGTLATDKPAANVKPAWMRESPAKASSQRPPHHRTDGRPDREITRAASEIGANLLRSANTVWNGGRRKVQKAVGDPQRDRPSSHPRWMTEARRHRGGEDQTTSADQRDPNGQIRSSTVGSDDASDSYGRHRPDPVTQEALMLEPDHPRARRPERSGWKDRQTSPDLGLMETQRDGFRTASHNAEKATSRPQHLAELNDRGSGHDLRPTSTLNKRSTDEQSAQAYVSPARRRKPISNSPTAQPDLIFTDSHGEEDPSFSPLFTSPHRQPTPARGLEEQTAIVQGQRSTRLRLPTRVVPPTSTATLSTSATLRQTGSEHFKRGDYSAAHSSYTTALTALPAQHPWVIVILCNRALVNIKIGDPKAALTDAEMALAIIGPSQGEGETIGLGGGDGDKDMRTFFSKAVIRKAESLEQLEKWEDAAKAWKDAVEAGIGRPTTIQARDRCEEAARKLSHPQRSVLLGSAVDSAKCPPSRPARTRKAGIRPTTTATSSIVSTGPSSEAVKKLRRANQAAERTDAEKFALADSVDARLTTWKTGKQDNIRALLGSLDTILWPEAGWKKVGMHELVVTNKVKIVYMKAIAKVHPDKVRQAFFFFFFFFFPPYLQFYIEFSYDPLFFSFSFFSLLFPFRRGRIIYRLIVIHDENLDPDHRHHGTAND